MERRFNAVLDRRGNAIVGASVTVRDSAGSVATIYSDDGVTTATNPLTTNDDGEYTYFAANGKYTEDIVGEGYVAETISDIVFYDPSDVAWLEVVTTTSTSYSVGTANFGAWLDVDTASTATVTLPSGAFLNGRGASVLVRQKGAGQVLLSAGGGVTVVNPSTAKTRAQYSAIGAQAISTTVWTVFGDVE